MNYEEFPLIKEKYVPVCLDMNIKPISIPKEIEQVQISPRIITETITKIIHEPVYIEKEVFIERPKDKKPRKKYDFLNYPNHWDDRIKAKYKAYYFRIRQKGKQFSLTFEEFESLLTQQCVFCFFGENITIDRKDSNIGYELFNCQSCCYTCNMMKHSLNEYSFLDQVIKIYQHQMNK